MSRRSSRLVLQQSSPAAAAAAAAEQPQKKRPSDSTAAPSARESNRVSKRQKSSDPRVSSRETKPARSTGRKSKYFTKEPAESLDAESPETPDVASATPSAYGEGGEDSAAALSGTDEPETAQDESESEAKPTKKRGGWGWAAGRKRKNTGDEAGTSSTKERKGKELWREGVKAGLGPGKEVFIKLPKARDAGDTPYEDGTIHPNTMLFLKDLKKNNQREWFKTHDADFRTSKRDWDTFVESLTEKIIEKDSTIPELPAKDLVFRIYRDIRFSNDPTPYKPHFSAAWSRTGRKGPYAAYYVHLEPGKCFVGSGLWHPDADKLALLRQDMDRNSRRIKSVLNAPDVRREIFRGIPRNEKEAVSAFVGQNQENALKTKPKGYDADNKNIDLLRLRNFTIGKAFQDKDMLGPGSLDRVAHIVGIMEPFKPQLHGIYFSPSHGLRPFVSPPYGGERPVFAIRSQGSPQRGGLGTPAGILPSFRHFCVPPPGPRQPSNLSCGVIHKLRRKFLRKAKLHTTLEDPAYHRIDYYGVVTYLNTVVMPDAPQDGDSDDEDGEEDDVEEGSEQGGNETSEDASEPE
ncbi:hypothetical protein AJ79_03762 [Helicocarpus griseus UAMH5409]|uniref:TIGR02453 family protein n=1 Tax=Helicocarpus griseus UAMH5409 TaxID=1447875 RepID=A0A2B7XW73_9EURO|nr:hypothetical protein AJ79_03762 [Helicocarpus griseus UAMH5409]